jgi:NAD(P)H dehydrogenase (quinone)
MRRDPSYLSYALEQRHAIQLDTLAPDIGREVERVLAADLLILIFPVFWFSLPAMLKGWIDRIFLSGLFYGGRRFYGRGPMAGRRAMMVASMGARAHMFGLHALHGEIEPMFRHLTRGTLGYVGYDVLEPFWAFHVPYVSDEERRGELDRLRRHLARLDALPVLPVPDLAGYDAQMAACAAEHLSYGGSGKR